MEGTGSSVGSVGMGSRACVTGVLIAGIGLGAGGDSRGATCGGGVIRLISIGGGDSGANNWVCRRLSRATSPAAWTITVSSTATSIRRDWPFHAKMICSCCNVTCIMKYCRFKNHVITVQSYICYGVLCILGYCMQPLP